MSRSAIGVVGFVPVSSRVDIFLATPAPRLPRRDGVARVGGPLLGSFLFHAGAAAVLVVGLTASRAAPSAGSARPTALSAPQIVFFARPGPGGGGGGGGNRQPAPAGRAQGLGRDRLTRPVARPIVAPTTKPSDAPPPPQLALDAMPLANGSFPTVGLPEAPFVAGASRGPGSGGGVGDGVGTGIGPGAGPGVGPGSGGGTGGGVYLPGNGVTIPILVKQVKPVYTADALRRRVQGSVFLEIMVRRDGTPDEIRVVRSLDAALDEQALVAVQQWRFVPGRRAGEPVDVLVSVILDFTIR